MQELSGWRYYNHAIIPNVAPHENVDLSVIHDGSVWRYYPKAVVARWAEDFDCGYETNWWYVIKDQPFDISTLKAKRRYEINHGNRHFDVKMINPQEYTKELFEVQEAAFSGWPPKYRPKVSFDGFVKSVEGWKEYCVFGAFSKSEGTLCGYALLEKCENYVDFKVLRTNPAFERYGINAAVVYGILKENQEFLSHGGYISDGSRSIQHETAFQEYLEKYFGFRKAYCKLVVHFRPGVELIIRLLYPIRKWLRRADSIGIVHKINGLLKTMEFAKEQVITE